MAPTPGAAALISCVLALLGLRNRFEEARELAGAQQPASSMPCAGLVHAPSWTVAFPYLEVPFQLPDAEPPASVSLRSGS